MSDLSSLPAYNPAKNRARAFSVATLVSLCVSLAVVAPFFKFGTASGHDIAFHMGSWLDVAGQWKQGILFPRWAEWANFGFGEPRFIFYPPLSWLIGAFLGTVFPWQHVAVIFIICVQTLAGLSAHALTRRISESRFASLSLAACYAANPYALLVTYVRSDFAELLALAFFPLLLLATLRLTGLLGAERNPGYCQIFFFALSYAAIWLSNAPAAVIASYSVALLVVFAAIKRRSLEPVFAGGAGLALGFGLASFYLIPAIYEQRWVNIQGALLAGLAPEDNFLYSKTPDSDHDAFNRIASNLALLLIVWAAAAAVSAWRASSSRSSTARAPVGAIAALAAAAALLMFPVTQIFWRVLPELRFVQFPWRWMSVVALCAVASMAFTARAWLRWAWFLVAVSAIIVSAHYLVKNTWWDTDDMPDLQAAIRSGAGFEGTDEYDPVGDDHTDLAPKDPRVKFVTSAPDLAPHPEANLSIEKWNVEHRVVRLRTRIDGKLLLHLVNYPAWRATLNGKPVRIEHPSGTEQVAVPISAGESELRIDFTRTADRTLGGWISVASLVGSLSAWFWKRRRPAPHSANA